MRKASHPQFSRAGIGVSPKVHLLAPFMIHSSTSSTFSSSYPALHSPWSPLPDSKRTPTPRAMSSLFLTPPKYPSYLKYTRYSDLALEKYTTCQKKLHRKLYDEHNVPSGDIDLRLPNVFNLNDKSPHIRIRTDGLDLTYTGPGKTESHAASVRTDHPMPSQCGIYYYEITVLSKGDDGYIGVGFCSGKNALARLPGWDPNSWGYHGDDGHSFAGSGTGAVYGPCFTTGDVIGCGVNFAAKSAFYTKNGMFLGVAFDNIDISFPLYPCVGLRTTGESVTANFGDEPFMFDIVQHVKEQKHLLWSVIASRSHNPYELDQLVSSYLVHQGYRLTAKAIINEARCVNGSPLADSRDSEDKDMEERQSIRCAIILGDIDLAIKMTQKYFPGVLEGSSRGEEVLFELKCHKFVELIRGASPDYTPGMDESHSHSIYTDSDENGQASHSQTHIPSLERRRSWANVAASPLKNQPSLRLSGSLSSSMDLDEDIQRMSANRRSPDQHEHYFNGEQHNSNKREAESIREEGEDIGGHDDVTSSTMKMRRVIEYGQALQEEYGSSSATKARIRLVEIFSLLAYPNPNTSPVAHLMDVAGREALAAELNSLILLSQKRPDTSALERVYRQALAVNNELSRHGNGTASLIGVAET